MQIPPASSAAQAAGIASQANSSSSSSGSSGTAGSASQQVSQVEQSGDSNPDRDAQGQGDGLGERGEQQSRDEETTQPTAKSNQDIIELSESTTEGSPIILNVDENLPPTESSLDLLG